MRSHSELPGGHEFGGDTPTHYSDDRGKSRDFLESLGQKRTSNITMEVKYVSSLIPTPVDWWWLPGAALRDGA